MVKCENILQYTYRDTLKLGLLYMLSMGCLLTVSYPSCSSVFGKGFERLKNYPTVILTHFVASSSLEFKLT